MKLVVTGATGHLGSYVVAELSARGDDVVAVSRSGQLPEPPFGSRGPLQRVRPLAVDIADDAAVELLARELAADVGLIHLAAWHPPATASTSPADRDALLEVNVLGLMRVLESARRSRRGVAAVIYASSFEVYAPLEAGAQALSEAARVDPRTDYGATKLAGEDHLLSFAAEEQTRAVALRFPAIYGPGERTARALPNFLRAVAQGKSPQLQGDGADLRDQIHVRDAAHACICALTTSAAGIFNAADGKPHSIAELARTALELAALEAEVVSLPRAKPRCDYHMSIERARSQLGFSPALELRAGMAEELAWIRAGG